MVNLPARGRPLGLSLEEERLFDAVHSSIGPEPHDLQHYGTERLPIGEHHGATLERAEQVIARGPHTARTALAVHLPSVHC